MNPKFNRNSDPIEVLEFMEKKLRSECGLAWVFRGTMRKALRALLESWTGKDTPGTYSYMDKEKVLQRAREVYLSLYGKTKLGIVSLELTKRASLLVLGWWEESQAWREAILGAQYYCLENPDHLN